MSRSITWPRGVAPGERGVLEVEDPDPALNSWTGSDKGMRRFADAATVSMAVFQRMRDNPESRRARNDRAYRRHTRRRRDGGGG